MINWDKIMKNKQTYQKLEKPVLELETRSSAMSDVSFEANFFSNTGIEKRRHPRIPVTWPVVLMTSQKALKGKTSNISVSGALILFSKMPEIDVELQITFKSSKDHEMFVTCEKTWSYCFNTDGSVFNGIGVRFVNISSNDREIIASLVAEYQL